MCFKKINQIKNVISLFCFFWLSTLILYSQRYNTVIYDHKNGIEASELTSVAFEDKSNKMWLTTKSEGVYSFDGVNWTNHEIKQGDVPMHTKLFLKDKYGNVWFINSSFHFLFFSKIIKGNFSKLDSIPYFNQSFLNLIKMDLFIKDDTFFVCQVFNDKFVVFNLINKQTKTILHQEKINNFNIVNNRVLVSCKNGLFEYSYDFKTKFKLFNFQTFGIEYSNLDKKYFIVQNHELIILNQSLYNVKKIKLPIKKNYFVKIKLIENFLFLYGNEKTLTYNIVKNEISFLGQKEGLIEDVTNQIQQDNEGNIWFSQNSGIVKLPCLQFKKISGREMGFEKNDISAIKLNKNFKVIASVMEYKYDFLCQVVKKQSSEKNSRILDLSINNNLIMISYFKGLSVFVKNQLITNFEDNVNSGYMSTIKLMKTQYFSKNDTLYEYKNKSKKKFIFKINSGTIIRKLSKKSDTEIVLCCLREAYLLNLINLKSTRFKIQNSIYDYCYDSVEQRHYFACHDGLYYEKNNQVEKINFNENVKVFSVKLDRYRKLWLGTNNGVFVIKTNGDLIYHFNLKNGLLGKDVNRGAFEFDEEDNIWIGTTEGLNIIPLNFTLNINVPEMILKNLFINEKLISDASINKFKYNENNIQFEFEFASFANETENQFSYFLEELDLGWTSFNNESKISFRNLSPGVYKLYFKAKNALGVETKVYSYSFEILPPWWRTWWFYTLLTLALSSATYIVFKWRLKVLNQKEKNKFKLSESELKALRSQINPHYLSNSLTSLQKLILKDNKLQAMEVLNKYGKVMRNILNNSENQFIPLINEINTLKEYIELEKLLHFEDSEFHIHYDTISKTDLEKIQIPTMLIQPFVENAIIHGLNKKLSGIKKLTLTFTFNQKLECVIEDNGVGRDLSKLENKANSKGNANVEQRLKLYGELLKQDIGFEIIDLIDKRNSAIGTKVILSLPYQFTSINDKI